MVEPHNPLKASNDDVEPHIRPFDEPTAYDGPPSGLSLADQVVAQLARLREEYQQLRTWLEVARRQLSQREDEVDQRLQDAIDLMQRSHGLLDNDPDPSSEPDAAGQITLHVRTLGKFAVRCGDRAVPVGSSKKGRAVLRYLITRPERRATKDVLLDLFWPGEPVERSNHKLHIALCSLRQAMREAVGVALGEGEECVLFEDDCYSLHPGIRLDLDTERFAAHCRAGDRLRREGRLPEAVVEYESARALYRGDFLTEDLYADWAIAPRARLEEMYLMALGHLAEGHLDRGQFAESISCCRQILARDSYREDAYRQLMRCYSRMGQRNQALCEFLSCKQVLQRELGVGPMQETIALYEQIVREEPV
jgi:DNA-binding SARP family transcriptional activator